MSGAIAKVCAAINNDHSVVRLYADEMREVIDALDDRERANGRESDRAEAAEAERDGLREELARVRAAVRMHESARVQCEAHDAATLRSLAGEDRAALIEELAAARDEASRWNARATALEEERDGAVTALATERALRREHGQRIGWAESVAAAAMRQGLAACTLLRERRERLWVRVRAAEHDPFRSRWLLRVRTLTAERNAARAEAALQQVVTAEALDGAPVDGGARRSPPTRAEVIAHFAAHGGFWLVSRVHQGHPARGTDVRPMVLRLRDDGEGFVQASTPGIDYGGAWEEDPWRLMEGATWHPLSATGTLLAGGLDAERGSMEARIEAVERECERWRSLWERKVEESTAALEAATAAWCEARSTGEQALTLGLAECERLRAERISVEAAFRAGTHAAAAWLDQRARAQRELANHTESAPPPGCPADIAYRLVEDGRDAATQAEFDARLVRALPWPESMSAEVREVDRAYRVEVERWTTQALARVKLARANGLRWRGERDAARAAVTGLREEAEAREAENASLRLVATAVRREREVRGAWLATLPACATAPSAVLSAEAETGAALDGVATPSPCEECNALQAALRERSEGRTVPPTDAEIRAHSDAGGAWLVTLPARAQVRRVPETRYTADPGEAQRLYWAEGARWIAVREGRPCAWPTGTS